MSSSRPLPVPDELSTTFWGFAAQHTLSIARCSRCRSFCHPPDVVCPHCQHTEPEFVFEPVGGTGAIKSWIVVRQSFLPGFDDVPFVLVDVALDDVDDVRLIGRLLDGPAAPIAHGAKVRVSFEDLDTDVAVPAFELVGTP